MIKRRKNMIIGIIILCTLIGSKIANTAYLPWPTIMQNNQRTSVYPGFGEIGNMHTVDFKWRITNISSLSNLAALGDLDGDNVADVVVVSSGGTVCVLEGTDGSIRWTKSLGANVYSAAPALADIDGDNTIEIVIGATNGTVYALDGTNGNIEWSKNVSGQEIWSSPAIGDIDGIGATIEVVMVLKDKTVALKGGSNGDILWTQPLAAAEMVPALGDVDGDGAIEVISGSSNNIYALNGATGAIKWTTSVSGAGATEYVFIPSIADIDNDDTVEVVVQPSSYVYAINGTNGNIKWTKNFGILQGGTTTYAGVALGDIDGDAGLEVIIRDGFSKIYALDENTGNILWSYPHPSSQGFVKAIPILADVEDEGVLEVVTGDHSGYIPCLESESGAEKWNLQLNPGDLHCNHSVGDIDGDGCFEIVGISCGAMGASYAKVYAIEAECPVNRIEENELIERDIDFKAFARKNDMEISFYLPNNVDVSISIFDVCGRERSCLNLGRLGIGNHQISLNISEFENSVYFVRLSLGKKYLTKKVMVIK